MNVILFDDDRENLYPLSFTRPISDFRVGISTIKEKWEFYYNDVSVKTETQQISDKKILLKYLINPKNLKFHLLNQH